MRYSITLDSPGTQREPARPTEARGSLEKRQTACVLPPVGQQTKCSIPCHIPVTEKCSYRDPHADADITGSADFMVSTLGAGGKAGLRSGDKQ